MISTSPLHSLLTYIEEVERLNKTPSFRVSDEFFSLAGVDLPSCPEVACDLEQDGAAWLVVPRLQETAPPVLPERLKPYVQLSSSTGKEPSWSAPESGDETELSELRRQLESYVRETWAPWAAAEAARRRTIALYKGLFALQQSLAGVDDAALELVWGMGLAAWTHPGGKVVNHPLLTQGCYVELDHETFALTVRPRDVETHLELDCYVELDIAGVRDLELFWERRRALNAAVNPFQLDTFVDVLRAAVSSLDSGGALVSGAPAAGAHLAVGSGWVLFARKRSADVFVEDVRRFRQELDNGASVPEVVQAFVTEAKDQVRAVPHLEFRGLSSSSSAAGVHELFFPLPYNDEQVDIVRKLESSDGVVVQGPPGTGKTHTIANIVSHYLAQGKRVLVTSKGDTALTVLREKLPEGIRDLSVALLSNERAGMRQFEHSIQQIAAQVGAIRPDALHANIAHLTDSLARTHAKVAYLDAQLADFAAKHSAQLDLAGEPFRADELARRVVATAAESAWLKDSVVAQAELPLDDALVVSVRAARRRVGADLSHLTASLPPVELLMPWGELQSLRANLLREQVLRRQVASGYLAPLAHANIAPSALETALRDSEEVHTKLSQTHAGLLQLVQACPPGSPVGSRVQVMAETLGGLEDRRQVLMAEAVTLPEGVELDEDFLTAVDRLVAGKPAFGFGAALFGGKKDLQRQMAQCMVLGVPAKTPEQWVLIKSALPWRVEVRALIHRWNAMCSEFGLPPADTSLEAGFRQVGQHLPPVVAARSLVHTLLPSLRQQLVALFGLDVSAQVDTAAGVGSLIQALQAHLELTRLSGQRQSLSRLHHALERGRGALNQALLEFLQVKLSADAEENLAEEWVSLCSSVSRLQALGPDFQVVRAAADRLDSLGLANWAQALRTIPVVTEEDPALPQSWRTAWLCRQAESMLDAIDGHESLRSLHAQRHDLTEHLALTYKELVSEQAWLGVYLGSTDKTKQALQSFLTSIQAMGAGTGLRAVRHRRAAREALEKAYMSVPCWILPQWRISETLPAEMGLFDLVVIDEASQSDVSSLPAILRGKKLLVVGDHKQVSPSAVGVSEAKIASAYDRLLKDQPHGAHMTADKSIYDLARVVFAGQSVMLKEHFRCVPAIIEYSNREFYNGEIRALRVPRDSERLDPPLVDVYVKGGFRQGDKNVPEARAVVDEIQAILADPAMAGKTIGVVTLVGHEQAKLINDLVVARIAPHEILEREIAVGQPPAFQGRERDIMLVSMVLEVGDRSFSSALSVQQRLNVALSRARDRTYLFRSVPDGTFAADSVSGRLLAHFKEPFHISAEQKANLRDLCESGFEREMFDELVTRGYCVRPQVKAGGYRIDLVVEGSDGRRLAVECDGDRYHGADKWSADMARQRVLERAGWIFWRCFASSFTRRRQSVMLDLLSTLDSLGIEPLGDMSPAPDLVGYREVDPMGVQA